MLPEEAEAMFVTDRFIRLSSQFLFPLFKKSLPLLEMLIIPCSLALAFLYSPAMLSSKEEEALDTVSITAPAEVGLKFILAPSSK